MVPGIHFFVVVFYIGFGLLDFSCICTSFMYSCFCMLMYVGVGVCRSEDKVECLSLLPILRQGLLVSLPTCMQAS